MQEPCKELCRALVQASRVRLAGIEQQRTSVGVAAARVNRQVFRQPDSMCALLNNLNGRRARAERIYRDGYLHGFDADAFCMIIPTLKIYEKNCSDAPRPGQLSRLTEHPSAEGDGSRSRRVPISTKSSDKISLIWQSQA